MNKRVNNDFEMYVKVMLSSRKRCAETIVVPSTKLVKFQHRPTIVLHT